MAADMLFQSRLNVFGQTFSWNTLSVFCYLSISCTYNRSPRAVRFPSSSPVPCFQSCWVFQMSLLAWCLMLAQTHSQVTRCNIRRYTTFIQHSLHHERYVKHSVSIKSWFSKRLSFGAGNEESWIFTIKASLFSIRHLMINGDKMSVTEWLTMASCNCVCLTALACIINYPQHCTDEKELGARRSRFYYWDWQRKQAVDSGSQHIECECIFHDRALGARETEGRRIEEILWCFFCEVHSSVITKGTCVLHFACCASVSVCGCVW